MPGQRASRPAFETPSGTCYGNRGGPRSGVATGLARPRKTTRPLPPQRVEAVSAGTSGPAHAWGASQLFATQTLPAGAITTGGVGLRPPPAVTGLFRGMGGAGGAAG